MITAQQSARLTAANRLMDARKALLESVSLICWTPEQARDLTAVIARLDQLFNDILPRDASFHEARIHDTYPPRAEE